MRFRFAGRMAGLPRLHLWATRMLRRALAAARAAWDGTDADVRLASDLYSRIVEEVLASAKMSLKGTPTDLVAHGRYEIAMHPSTLEGHMFVLDVYRRNLIHELEEWRDAVRMTAWCEFTVPVAIEFIEDTTLELGDIRVAASAAGVCVLYRAESADGGETQEVSPAMRVRWEGDDVDSVEFEFAMRRAPYVLGRDQTEPRCRVSESLRTGREQALLQGITETGQWWIVDGRLDGSPATNPTRVDGAPLPHGLRRRLLPGMTVGFPDRAAGSWTVLQA